MGIGVRLFGQRGDAAVAGSVETDPSPAPGREAVAAVVTHEGVPFPVAAPITHLALPLPLMTGLSDIVSQELMVPLAHLVPNPRHPRNDWGQPSDELDALAEHLTAVGPLVPITCTPDQHDATGPLHIVKGHRHFAAARLAAARRAQLDEVKVHLLTHADGRPLSSYEQLTYWLITTHAGKKPSDDQTTVALVLWLQERKPAQREIAQCLRVALGTVNRAIQITEELEPIVVAVTSHRLQLDAALRLRDVMPDPPRRVVFVASVLRRNAERRDQSQVPLTVKQILDLACSEQAQHQGLRSPVALFGTRPHPPQPTERTLSTMPTVPHTLSMPAARDTMAGGIEPPLSRTRNRPPAQRPHPEVLTVLERDPQASDVAILVASTRDMLCWFDRVVSAGSPLSRLLRKRYRAFEQPRVEAALEALLAQERLPVSGGTSAAQSGSYHQEPNASAAPRENAAGVERMRLP